MSRRFFRSALIALSLAAPATHAAAGQAGNAAASPAFAPALHVFIGPDSNACGFTLPARKPAKPGPKPGLIIWLHGGMRSQNREKGLEAHRALLAFVPVDRYILASPSAFAGQEWTTPQGIAHIDALIDTIAAQHPFDPRDINLVGVSDGTLGVIAYSLEGKRELHRRVLISSAPQWLVPAQMLPRKTRFAQGSWDFLQGGRDRLFPADQVVPYLKQWETVFPNSHLHYFPDGEHDFSFYSENAAELLKSLLAPAGAPRTRPAAKPGQP